MKDRIPQAIVLSFASVITVGALLLLLPQCGARGGLTWLQALFTATSAVCVTGLTVINPGTDLSPFGQAVLLLLIQCGGLGILSLSAFVVLALSRREALSQRMYVETAHGGVRGVPPLMVLRHVVVTTALVESAGIALLFLGFGLRRGAFDGRALWDAVFHAISAFCNAGFSLFSNNLEGYRDDPVVSLTVIALIVVGGIGFTVLADLGRLFRAPARQRQWWRLALHTRMVLLTTATFIVGGAMFFALFEWGNTLKEAPIAGKILAPLFYSVTCRTAGYNTIRTSMLAGPTLVLGILLMFVGASPGGTGGGVKTTSAAVLWALARSRAKGRTAVEFLGRTLPVEIVAKVIATVSAFAILLTVANIGLQLTETGLVPHEQKTAPLLDNVYETVSAIGTVGLSTGITSRLSAPGQLILIALMFAGRTGPLVIGASLIGRRRKTLRALPEEPVLVG